MPLLSIPLTIIGPLIALVTGLGGGAFFVALYKAPAERRQTVAHTDQVVVTTAAALVESQRDVLNDFRDALKEAGDKIDVASDRITALENTVLIVGRERDALTLERNAAVGRAEKLQERIAVLEAEVEHHKTEIAQLRKQLNGHGAT